MTFATGATSILADPTEIKLPIIHWGLAGTTTAVCGHLDPMRKDALTANLDIVNCPLCIEWAHS